MNPIVGSRPPRTSVLPWSRIRGQVAAVEAGRPPARGPGPGERCE
jgi:hypothetical protein